MLHNFFKICWLKTIYGFHGSVDLVGSAGITHAVTATKCCLELISSKSSISIWLNIQDGFFYSGV